MIKPNDDAVRVDSWRTDRVISHDEAREIAGRLINSHFRKEPCARVGIPARPDYDDDLLICTYIEQQKERESRPTAATGGGVDATFLRNCPHDLDRVRAGLKNIVDMKNPMPRAAVREACAELLASLASTPSRTGE